MSKARNSYRFTTVAGELSYNHFTQPDTKYGAPTWQTTISFPEEVGRQEVAKMEALDPRFRGMIRSKVVDGKLQLKVKQKRFVTWYSQGAQQSKEFIPVVVDAENQPYKGDEPWSGSTGAVGLTVDMSKDNNGKPIVQLRLRGVRLHEVKLGGGGNDDPLFGGGATPAATSNEETDESFADDDADSDSFFS